MPSIQEWLREYTKEPGGRRLYEEERLILWTTEELAKAMAARELTRAALAEKLGTNRANITRLLSGSRNMTLRSLAAMAHACGMRAVVELEEMHEEALRPVENSSRFRLRIPRGWGSVRAAPCETGAQQGDADTEGELADPFLAG